VLLVIVRAYRVRGVWLVRGTISAMLQVVREMPPGVLIFLGYAFLVLAFLGLTMPIVIEEAVVAPISFVGVVWMAALAYLIFTMTLVLQRKQAAFNLAMGLISLLVPLGIVSLFSPQGGTLGAILALSVCAFLFFLLRRPTSRAWFVEP
jgi:hypothetical protein